MYSEQPAIKSAKRAWNKAGAQKRIRLLRAAGCGGMAQAYRKFDELPLAVKLDLNGLINQTAQQDAAQGQPAPTQPALI